MTLVNENKLKEFETWLSLLTNRTLPKRHKWKAWFCVAEYEQSDFQNISSILQQYDSTASFAFLGRDAEEHSDIMQMLLDDGHEIAFHSHRHHTYADLSYETAHDAITKGVSAIENETGITPQGFFVPFFELSDGSIQAIEDFGFDWLLASTDQELSNVETREPAWPLDTKRFEEDSVSEVMKQFTREARSGEGPFLFHPPVIEYRNGIANLERWIDSIQPVSMAEQLQSGGTGIVLDCIQPVRIE